MGIISIKDRSGRLSLARQMARDTRVARCGAMWGAPMLRLMTVVRRVGALARGVSTGAVTALTAVSAHGWSGGHWPSAGQITVLLAVCSGLGAIAGGLNALARRWTLLGYLTGGQMLCHLMLSTAVGPGHHAGPSMSTVSAHAVAVGIGVCLLVAVEAALRWCVASTVQVISLMAQPHRLDETTGMLAATSVAVVVLPRVWERGTVSRRGPPVVGAS